MSVLRERSPASEDEAPAQLQRAADVAEGRRRIGEEHDAHARGREIEGDRLELKHLRIPKQQCDIAQRALGDPLPRNLKHRLGDVDRDDAAMLADRRGERHSQCAGTAADFEHALAAGNAQTRQQQLRAFSVASLPEPWGGDPARPGDRIPVAALHRVRVEGFPSHVARSSRLGPLPRRS